MCHTAPNTSSSEQLLNLGELDRFKELILSPTNADLKQKEVF
jgi:hypothetical protein